MQPLRLFSPFAFFGTLVQAEIGSHNREEQKSDVQSGRERRGIAGSIALGNGGEEHHQRGEKAPVDHAAEQGGMLVDACCCIAALR